MVGWTSSAEAYLCLRFMRALLQSEEEEGEGEEEKIGKGKRW